MSGENTPMSYKHQCLSLPEPAHTKHTDRKQLIQKHRKKTQEGCEQVFSLHNTHDQFIRYPIRIYYSGDEEPSPIQ